MPLFQCVTELIPFVQPNLDDGQPKCLNSLRLQDMSLTLILGEDYFERLLEEIREIRLSERRFYQKSTESSRVFGAFLLFPGLTGIIS